MHIARNRGSEVLQLHANTKRKVKMRKGLVRSACLLSRGLVPFLWSWPPSRHGSPRAWQPRCCSARLALRVRAPLRRALVDAERCGADADGQLAHRCEPFAVRRCRGTAQREPQLLTHQPQLHLPRHLRQRNGDVYPQGV